MNDPAVLFYTSDFLTGVIDMNMEERGQYITLLCYQHQKGHFEEKTTRLLVGLTNDTVMKHFIKDEKGLLYNKRMDLEKEKRRVFVESRRENAKKGGRPKSGNNKPSAKPSEKHKHSLMGNENDNDNRIIIDNKIEEEFNQLWELYPNKQGKKKALEYYKKEKKKNKDIFNIIKQGIENYIKWIIANEQQKYIKQGSTWFNQECWNDDYSIKTKQTTKNLDIDISDF